MAKLYFCHMRNQIAVGQPTAPIGLARRTVSSASSPSIGTIFLRHVQNGDLPAVHHLVLQHRWLLEANLGSSPILLALKHKRRAVANVLALLGMKLTVLEAAALGNEKRVLEWLGFHPAAVHARDEYGWTALHHAVAGGHRNIVKALLDAGADPLAFVSGSAVRALDLALDAKTQALLRQAINKSRAMAA